MMIQHRSRLLFLLAWASQLPQNCHGATLRGDKMEKRRLEDESQPTACTLIEAKDDFCPSDFQGARPWCTPYVSPDFCPRDIAFSSLIAERTRVVKDGQGKLGDWWFHHLEDKMAAYAFSVTNGFTAPKLYYCGSLQEVDFDSLPSSFVIRASGLHSSKGIYAFPNGLGAVEVLRGMELDLKDVETDLMIQGAPDLVLIEEFVPGEHASSTLPTEFKFHVIDGVILSVNAVYNRGTPWGSTADDDGCHGIDFVTGSKASAPIKGFDLCSTVPFIDPCVWKHMLQEARRASKLIGVYVRIDMFLGKDGQFYVQEYSTNHMNGLRHCSAKIADNGCIDACFQGRLWQAAGGNMTMGGPMKALPSEMAGFLQEETTESKCMAVVNYASATNDSFDCQDDDENIVDEEKSGIPTVNPSVSPTLLPSVQPTSDFPADYPSAKPSGVLSAGPSETRSDLLSVRPSVNPSNNLSVSPSDDPSNMPSASPSDDQSDSPSETHATESPTIAPTAGPTGIPLSDTARDFINRSFAGGSTNGVVSQKLIEMEGSLYEANYNVSINEAGVVSLAAVRNLIGNVTCRNNESIVIDFDANITAIDATELEKMFPVGSILTIDSDVFGPCRLSVDTALPDLAPNETMLPFEDGFMFIENVVESLSVVEGRRRVVINGEDTSYFAMFSEGDITLERVEPLASGRGSRGLATIRRSFKQEFDVLDGLFEVTAQLQMTHIVDFQVMRAHWNISGFDLTVEAATESVYEAELSMLLRIGIFEKGKEFSFVSIPLYGIPSFPLLEKFKIPSPKLGFYFETPIFLNVDASLQKQFGASGQLELRTGRKVIQYFIRGSFAEGLAAGSSTISDEPASQLASAAPIGEFLSEPFVLQIDFFVGIRPLVALYVTKILSAGISLDVGVEFATQYPLSSDAFRPLPPPGFGVPQFFECETCHKVRVDVEFQVTNLKLFAKAVLKVKYKVLSYKFKKVFEATFPGNPTFSIPLATACFFKQFGENTETCGDVCCDEEDGQVCELDDSLSPPSGNCGMPSAAPTPPPTFPRVRISGIFGDPHLSTFDRLRYDCQAAGEFTMVKSLDSGFEIQERFVAVGELPCSQSKRLDRSCHSGREFPHRAVLGERKWH